MTGFRRHQIVPLIFILVTAGVVIIVLVSQKLFLKPGVFKNILQNYLPRTMKGESSRIVLLNQSTKNLTFPSRTVDESHLNVQAKNNSLSETVLFTPKADNVNCSTTSKCGTYRLKLRQHGLEPTALHDFKSPYIFDPPVHDLDSDLHKAPGKREVKIISCFHCQPWFITEHLTDHNRDFKRCPYSECVFDKTGIRRAKADLVMIFPHSGQIPPRPVGQIWAYSFWEAPPLNRFPAAGSQWNKVFNWSIGYREDSDAFFPYNRLAWTAQENLLEDVEYERIAKLKSKTAAWLVSNCGVVSRRDQYISTMKKYIDIDIYGRCGSGRVDLPTFLKSLNTTYKFYLGFENAFCKDYVTEKLFRNFDGRLHVVTVVRGGFDYRKYLPPNTFIDAKDFGSPKELALYLKALGNDVKSYSKMLKEKDKLRTLNYKHDWCQLCERLHRGVTPKVIPNVRKYLFDKTCWN